MVVSCSVEDTGSRTRAGSDVGEARTRRMKSPGNAKNRPVWRERRRGGVSGAKERRKLDQPGYPLVSGEDGRLRVAEVVAEPVSARRVRTTLIRDATSRISDTRVRCMPRVA